MWGKGIQKQEDAEGKLRKMDAVEWMRYYLEAENQGYGGSISSAET